MTARRSTPRHGDQFIDGDRLAKALGWFSIGLGIAQIAAPKGMARLIGIKGGRRKRATMRAVGAREIVAGVGLLSRRGTDRWAWGRVAGDAMDIALVGSALRSNENRRPRAAATLVALVGIAALDAYSAKRLTDDRRASTDGRMQGIRVQKSITVNLPADEVYEFWRDFENLPLFMEHLESVEMTGERSSRWKAKAPAGMTVEWEAELTDDRPNQLIAWQSVEGSEIPNSGQVRFTVAPGGRGTEIHVDLRYEPPAGKVGAMIAKLFGEEPNQQVDGDLRRLKQVLELGEVVYSDASIAKGMHPAQPAGDARLLDHDDHEETFLPEHTGYGSSTQSTEFGREL